MTVDPFVQFLGVPESADPMTLLDLSADRSGLADIYTALYRRMVAVHRHPHGQTKAAEAVCRRLRSAAKLLGGATRHRQSDEAPPANPFRNLLRVAPFADPIELLGLPAGDFVPGVIDLALAERMKRVISHPDSKGPDADQIRQCLRAAASMLRDDDTRAALIAMRTNPAGPVPPTPRVVPEKRPSAPMTPTAPAPGLNGPGGSKPTSTPVPVSPPASAPRRTGTVARASRPLGPDAKLTHFDRQVLGVMVACGGWNARSRARLVGLAEMYQIAPDGLVKIMRGLSDVAKSRRARIRIDEITQDMPAAPSVAVAGSGPVGPVAGGEFSPGTPVDGKPVTAPFWNTVTLSVLSAMITTMIGVALIVFFLMGDAPEPTGEERIAGTTPVETIVDPDTPEQPAPVDRRLAPFPSAPTFVGNGFPKDAADAADECLSLPAEFDRLERLLSITDDPSEALYRDWDFFIDRFSTGWVLADRSTRSAVERAMMKTLRSVTDTPSVCDRLLQALTPSVTQVPDPVDVWRSAWRVYLLAVITHESRLSPAIVQQARRQLDITINRDLALLGTDPVAVARAWLDQAADILVDSIEYEPRAYDFWESWMAAQRELGVDASYDLALIEAAGRVVRTDTDLARPGPSVNVVGRLLGAIDLQRDAATRDVLLAWFDDDAVSNRDLWVVTSLLATAVPWFETRLVLPERADQLMRGRIRDFISQAWPDMTIVPTAPIPSSIGGVGATLASNWRDLVSEVHAAEPSTDDEAMALRLLAAALLNEAFDLMVRQREVEAQQLLDRVRGVMAGDVNAGSVGGQLRPGQPIGPDGRWAEQYRAIGRNTENRLNLLMTLASEAGTDLGQVDAQLLVHEAYRGVPQEIRERALSIVSSNFSSGPVVVMELIDQFPTAPRTSHVARLITRVTGGILPDLDSDTWTIDARRLLLRHGLRLLRAAGPTLAYVSSELNESMRRRRSMVLADSAPGGQGSATDDSGALLVAAWRDRAASMMVATPIPADLGGLDRRRMARLELAEGPIQRFVARQLSLLDLVAYVAVAENPARRETVLSILDRSATRRVRMGHVLDQAIEAQRAISEVHRLRMYDSDESTEGQP